MTIVKVCGITNLDDALCAIDAGADLLGFTFYPKSPRAVTMARAREIVARIRDYGPSIRCVGVFVNEAPEHILTVIKQVDLDAIQLSGTESLETLRALDGRGFKVIRKLQEAFTFGGHQTNLDLPELVLEADHPTLYGGTGQRADESLATSLAKRYRLLLAGGLTPDNVADAICVVKPWGVDVASGVEVSPGKKDHAKVRAFVAAAKVALRSQ